jgi:hypothetical protein
MEKLAKALVSDAFAQLARRFLELLSAPRRRVSVELDCEPRDESGESILTARPWAIARAIMLAIPGADIAWLVTYEDVALPYVPDYPGLLRRSWVS